MTEPVRSPLLELTRARVREFVRQKEALFWTFFFPVLMALGLGIAFRSQGPEPVRVGVPAGDGARALAERLEAGGDVSVSIRPATALRAALRDGEVAVVVERGPEAVLYRYDPTRPESRLARRVADDALQRAAGRTDPQATSDVPVEEKGTRYIDFLIPGLIGFNLLSTGLWAIGYALVRMRIGKLLKRLLATPMSRSQFLLSMILARLTFLVGEIGLILVFAWLVFDVTVAGSMLAFSGIVVLGALAFGGMGLLVASRARTLEGVSGLMNLTALPMVVLSGVFFSTEHFPEAIQPLIEALPLTALLDALRAVMLDGASLVATSGSLAIVAAWGALSFGTALAIFRWN